MVVKRPCIRRLSNLVAAAPNSLGTISEHTVTAINERFQASHADLVCVSSDGLTFKVHKAVLAACSSRLSALASPSSSNTFDTQQGTCTSVTGLPELHFHDPILESSITLSLFFHLLYQIALPSPTRPIYCSAYNLLIDFLIKYKCESLFPCLADTLRCWVQDGTVSPSKGLGMGDRLANISLCKASISMGGEYSWSGNRRGNVVGASLRGICHTGSLEGGPSLDMGSVPFDYFCSLSKETRFALLRAGRVARPLGKDEPVDWSAVAEKFEGVMQALRDAKQGSIASGLSEWNKPG
ncbi:hypothetical protein IAU60_002353 [Kwoniella sp. DSM 27419]